MFREIRLAFLPYCIKQVAPEWFVLLNRNYKPVGMLTNENIDYRPYAIKIKYLTSAKAAKLSAQGDPDRECIYLYNDGCKPTSSAEAEIAYFKRLALVARLRFDTGTRLQRTLA